MKGWPIPIALLAYLIFCVAAWEVYRRPVEDKLEAKAAATLAQIKAAEPLATQAQIDYTGMHGTLYGLDDNALAERIRDKVDSAVGWGKLALDMGAGQAPDSDDPHPSAEEGTPATFAMMPGEQKDLLVMWGDLPDDDLIDALVFGTRAECASVRWVDAEKLRRSEVEAPAWFEGLPAFVAALISNSQQATLQIDSGGFVVGGNVRDAQVEAQILGEARALAGPDVVDRIRVPGILQIARNDEGGISLSGVLGSDEDLVRIAESLGLDEKEAAGDGLSISPERYIPRTILERADLVAEMIGDRKGAMVGFDGQRFTVGGVARGEGEQEYLLELAHEISGGAFAVEDLLVVEELASLIVLKLGDEFELEGKLPGDGPAKLLAEMQGRFPLAAGIAAESLKTIPEGESATWLPRVLEALPDLLEPTDWGQVEVWDGGVVVQAGVRSVEAREKVLAQAAKIAGGEMPFEDAGVVVLKPPKLSISMKGDNIQLSGVLPAEDFGESLESSIRSYLSTAKVENKISADEAVWFPEWFEAAGESIPEFLLMAERAGEARIGIDGTKLTASARLQSDELKEPAQLLFSPLGRAGLEIDLKLAVLDQPRLVLEYGATGINLVGRLKREATKKKFIEAALGVHPDAAIFDKVIIDAAVADSGWDAKVLELVSESLSALKEPGIDLRPDKVRIEGEAESEEERTKFEQRLNAEFGAAFEIESAIRIPEIMVAEPRLEIDGKGGKWAIVGMVATDRERETIRKILGEAFPESEIEEDLEVTSEVAESPWLKSMKPLLEVMGEAKDPWILVFRGVISIEGEFEDEATKRKLGAAAADLEGLKMEDHSESKVPNGIVVPPPPPAAEDDGGRDSS